MGRIGALLAAVSSKLSYANVAASLALFMAVGGGEGRLRSPPATSPSTGSAPVC